MGLGEIFGVYILYGIEREGIRTNVFWDYSEEVGFWGVPIVSIFRSYSSGESENYESGGDLV